jgi:predicted acetyltransferase
MPTMNLVRPAPEHLASYIAALQQGWSPDTTRGADAAREALVRIEADPASVFALADDPDAQGPPWKAPDGTMKARIPGRVRWMWNEQGFVGSINLRWLKGTHALPPHVLGHIGYAVVPWQRQRGHATRALGLLLPLARAEGLAHVDITTDPENTDSQKVILANGGVLIERFDKGPTWGNQPGLRFRIQLTL